MNHIDVLTFNSFSLAFQACVAKLRKATINVVISVRLFDGRHGKFCFHWKDFHEIWYLRICRKSIEKIQVSLKSDKNKGSVYEYQYTFLIISPSFLLRMINVSDKSCRGNQNTHFVVSNRFSKKKIPLVILIWKNILERGRNMALVYCMLDT